MATTWPGPRTVKARKLVLLAATLWPPIYVVLFIGFIVTMVFTVPLQTPHTAAVPGGADWFTKLFIVHIFTMLLCLALTAIYIVDVFRNARVAKDQKALWAIVLFMGSFLAMPVYWYLFIWREPPAGA